MAHQELVVHRVLLESTERQEPQAQTELAEPQELLAQMELAVRREQAE